MRALPEKFADLQFFRGRICDPPLAVARELKRWDVLVPILFVNLERNRPGPFLPSHREKLFWCERIERHLLEEEKVGFAAQRGFVRQGRHELLELRPEFLERIRRALALHRSIPLR